MARAKKELWHKWILQELFYSIDPIKHVKRKLYWIINLYKHISRFLLLHQLCNIVGCRPDIRIFSIFNWSKIYSFKQC